MLARAGWSTQSAWLTSPTFGGISWLAHSTLQSGLWVNSKQRYDELVASQPVHPQRRLQQGRAGAPSPTTRPTTRTGRPARSSTTTTSSTTRHNVGYRGPKFSYAPMPDQYTFAAFQRNELGPGHKPVMAEIDLISSHTPWAPLPTMVPWNKVGDGSIFDPHARAERIRGHGLAQPQHRAPVLRPVDPVLADGPHVMGHRAERPEPRAHPARRPPARTPPSAGHGANHDVPISIVTRDPSVLRQIVLLALAERAAA